MYNLYFQPSGSSTPALTVLTVCLSIATDANTGLRYNGGLPICIGISTITDQKEISIYNNGKSARYQSRD
jgi:hypothetical protein